MKPRDQELRDKQVRVGIIGLGNVGLGTLQILIENARSIEEKLGFPLQVNAVCSRNLQQKTLPPLTDHVVRTTNWRELVGHPDLEVIVEAVGGIGTAGHIVEESLRAGKSVVTANKELIALRGPELWALANQNGTNLAMEASVAGGIPIHSVLREGIAGDRIIELYGILNGTSNFILTEIEKSNAAFESVLADAQKLGYAEADASSDIDGLDARAKLTILAALAFGEKLTAADVFTEGIRRLMPIDFEYAHQLKHTIRLLCVARQTPEGLFLSVRPSLIPQSAILAQVKGAYNAIWIRGAYSEDTFYYGRGAGSKPTGVAVVSDLMRVAREIRFGSHARVSPFAHERLGEYKPLSIRTQESPYYLRFRVEDKAGIIATLATILAKHNIGIDAVLQLPREDWRDLPFVVTTEPAKEQAIRDAMVEIRDADFLVDAPLAMPMERGF
ncbi:MAG: homoserine dehydrogenase [Acidobacteriaceae bacterium]|nr:homoserine dehydrogenase [Acidobacteriaceae bacterium]MBV9781626.1 homoserine dehydrogenase [Acidobacteriaceae bacterium]